VSVDIRNRDLARQRSRFEERLRHPIQVVDDGYRIKETETHYIDVMSMFVNWWITETRKDSPGTYDRSWCYPGVGLTGFLPAALAALAWDGSPDTEPAGYLKRAT
jgi:hypothetical protein